MSISAGDTDQTTALKLLAKVTARIDARGIRFERIPAGGLINTPWASTKTPLRKAT